MIDENIKRIRKAKGISQEELAVELHVVRQTVSKWEKGLSVPDAEVVIKMAAVLDVPVKEILGVEENQNALASTEELAQELARANEQITKHLHEKRNQAVAAQKRGLILFFSFATVISCFAFHNEVVSLALVAIFTMGSVVVLYRNLSLLTALTTDKPKSAVLKGVTIFNVAIFAFAIVSALGVAIGMISFKDDGRLLAMLLLASVMIFSGIVSPKLPFSRHTGLRLPWTISDEDTWNVAHRVLGITAIPVAIVYAACTLTISNFEWVTFCAVALWIGIPAGISYLYYGKRMRGKG